MTFGSLFAGIGGFDLGFERAGLECRWQVEIDDYCRRVLTKHWPSIPKYRDVTKFCRRSADCEPENEEGEVWCPRCDAEFGECECISTDQLLDECGPVDVICGGFPCQDISNAGKRAGIDGERSGLWAEYVRIVRELRPSYVVVENVAALLGRGMGRVLGDLAASGYDAEWDCLPAAAFGAPHIRDRVFILAERRVCGAGCCEGRSMAGSRRRRLFYSDQQPLQGSHSSGARGSRQNVADAASAGREGLRLPRLAAIAGVRVTAADANRPAPQRASVARKEHCGWESEPDVGRVAYGVPFELVCLGGINHESGNNPKKDTERVRANSAVRLLRSVWEHRELAETSPGLFKQRVLACVPEVSHADSYEGWYVGRGLKKMKACVVCGTTFIPNHSKKHATCSKNCLSELGRRNALRRWHPEWTDLKDSATPSCHK